MSRYRATAFKMHGLGNEGMATLPGLNQIQFEGPLLLERRASPMVTKYSIADILTLIRNADRDGKRTVQLPRTKTIEIIVKILLQEGLIELVIPIVKNPGDLSFILIR